MKIYVVADMEGIAGVVSHQEIAGGDSRDQLWAREQFTREVRAVCAGCLEAGAEEIVINDFHGDGRNLFLDQLPPEAQVIRGAFRPTSGFDLLDDTFTGLVLLGAHARTASREGVLAHTYCSLVSFSIFGQPMGEYDLLALLAGERKVPTLLISGDAKTIEQARTNLPATHTVISKFGINREAALCIQPDRVCRQLREETRRAVSNAKEIEPATIVPPIQLTVSLVSPTLADRLDWIPQLHRRGDTSYEFAGESMAQVARLIFGVTELLAAAAQG